MVQMVQMVWPGLACPVLGGPPHRTHQPARPTDSDTHHPPTLLTITYVHMYKSTINQSINQQHRDGRVGKGKGGGWMRSRPPLPLPLPLPLPGQPGLDVSDRVGFGQVVNQGRLWLVWFWSDTLRSIAFALATAWMRIRRISLMLLFGDVGSGLDSTVQDLAPFLSTLQTPFIYGVLEGDHSPLDIQCRRALWRASVRACGRVDADQKHTTHSCCDRAMQF